MLNHDYTWPNEMKEMLPPCQKKQHDRTDQSLVVHPQLVEPIWEAVNCGDENKQTDRGIDGVGIRAQYSTCFQGF